MGVGQVPCDGDLMNSVQVRKEAAVIEISVCCGVPDLFYFILVLRIRNQLISFGLQVSDNKSEKLVLQ